MSVHSTTKKVNEHDASEILKQMFFFSVICRKLRLVHPIAAQSTAGKRRVLFYFQEVKCSIHILTTIFPTVC